MIEIGQKVPVPQQHGYAPRIGEVIELYTNEYSQRMAVIEYKDGRRETKSVSGIERLIEEERQKKLHRDSSIRSDVYNALANIAREYDIQDEDEFTYAIEWFFTHFFEK